MFELIYWIRFFIKKKRKRAREREKEKKKGNRIATHTYLGEREKHAHYFLAAWWVTTRLNLHSSWFLLVSNRAIIHAFDNNNCVPNSQVNILILIIILLSSPDKRLSYILIIVLANIHSNKVYRIWVKINSKNTSCFCSLEDWCILSLSLNRSIYYEFPGDMFFTCDS